MGGTLLKICEFCSINYSYLQWRFREIATSNENHVFLAMTLNFVFSRIHQQHHNIILSCRCAEFLHTYMVFVNHHTYIGTSILRSFPYCHFVIKSLDREGWAVGEAVCYTSNILQQVGGNTTKSSRQSGVFLTMTLPRDCEAKQIQFCFVMTL